MQINDVVVCAWASNYTGLTTGKEYTVNNVFEDHGNKYITIIDNSGTRKSYDSSRFMLKSDMNEQVLENTING